MITPHPGVDGITFTGETRTGRPSSRRSPRRLKASSMEMGGKNAGIVFEDCDLDLAIKELGRACSPTPARSASAPSASTSSESIFDQVRRAPGDVRQDRTALRLPGRRRDQLRPAGLATSTATRCCRTTSSPRRRAPRSCTAAASPTFGDERDGGSWVEPTIWTGLAHNSRVATRGDLRPGRGPSSRSATRTRPSARQRHPVRPGGDLLQHQSSRVHRVAPQTGGRHRLGQQLVPPRPAHGLRRHRSTPASAVKAASTAWSSTPSCATSASRSDQHEVHGPGRSTAAGDLGQTQAREVDGRPRAHTHGETHRERTEGINSREVRAPGGPGPGRLGTRRPLPMTAPRLQARTETTEA